VNLGYRRQLRSNLALVVTLSDALDGQRFRRVVSTPVLQQTYVREQLGRILYVGLVGAFGASKKDKSTAFDYDR
jgi:hypothetical protein